MTVEVIWHDGRGAENRAEWTRHVNEFDSERDAGIFLDGLYAAERASFEFVRYPDSDVDDPYDFSENGCAHCAAQELEGGR